LFSLYGPWVTAPVSHRLPCAGPQSLALDHGPSERSHVDSNGSTAGADGFPSASGASSATAMPMFSYDAPIVVSYVALERRMSPGLTCTPQRGSPWTSIEKSHEVGGPPSWPGSVRDQ